MLLSSLTLAELMEDTDEAIRRNALGIYKRLISLHKETEEDIN